MPLATFIQHGAALDYRPELDTPAGAVVVRGDLVGVTTGPIKANTLGSIQVEGVFDFPKATSGGSAIADGVTVYWHADVQQANTTAAGGKALGKTVGATVDADVTVRVRLAQ